MNRATYQIQKKKKQFKLQVTLKRNKVTQKKTYIMKPNIRVMYVKISNSAHD